MMDDIPQSPPTAGAPVLKLLIEHRSSLFAFVLSLVRDFDRAEDVFQDVSVVICENAARFIPGSDFGAWAREIARRRILSNHRAAIRAPRSLPDEALQHIQQGFDALEAEDGGKDRRMRALRGCLERVESAARRFLALRYEQGLTVEEVARRAGQGSEGVRKLLYRTRMVLRDCIERRLRSEGERA